MFKVLKILLKCTTVLRFNWEPQTIYSLRTNLTYLLLSLSVIFCSVFAVKNTNITERCIAFTFAMSSLNGIVKVAVEKSQRPNVVWILDHLIQRETKIGFARTTRNLARVYSNMILVIVATWNIYPLLEGKMKSTIPIWFPFGIVDRTSFLTGYTFVLAMFFYQSTIHFSTECFVMLAVAEIRSDIDYLEKQAEKIGDYIDKKRDSNIQEQLERELNVIINRYLKRHIEIIKLTNSVTEMTKIIFLVQVVQSILMSCTCAYAVSTMTTPEEFVKFMPTILTIFWQLFIFCFYGQILKDKLESIHYYLFWQDWSSAPLTVQKKLLINLSYTAKVVEFNENLMFPMSIATFVQAIRESLSYYMFLRTVAKN